MELSGHNCLVDLWNKTNASVYRNWSTALMACSGHVAGTISDY